MIKPLVKKILEHPFTEEWSVQGLGMMRLYLDDRRVHRLHIWDSSLRVENVSAIHTHPWDFESLVVAGKVTNMKFIISDEEGVPHFRQSLRCGVGGGLEGTKECIQLKINSRTDILEGEKYTEKAEEIHLSLPRNGTVTIVTRSFTGDNDHAFVFWEDGEWVSAEPRAATDEEVYDVTQHALAKWF